MDIYKNTSNRNGDRADEPSTKKTQHMLFHGGMALADAADKITEFDYINLSQNSPEPPPPGEMSRKFAADVFPDCHLLMGVTQR